MFCWWMTPSFAERQLRKLFAWLARAVRRKSSSLPELLPVRYPNVYGIDMPTTAELIAGDNRPTEQIRIEIGADALVYQTIEGMKEAVGGLNPEIKRFDCSCFDGDYVTGDITPQYIAELEKKRMEAKAEAKKAASED